MHLLVHNMMLGAPEANTTTLWRAITLEYGVLGTPCRFGQMRMSMFNPKGASVFSANLRTLRTNKFIFYGTIQKLKNHI